tara:strand:+ start:339 stop:584 length:246 start_codon:yes stop_codon:yes gene_type:complete
MTHHQYDSFKQEVADMFKETDAIDEVLTDLKSVRNHQSIDKEMIEDLIELTEDWIHFNEDLEYILSQIPNHVKSVIVQEMA